MISSAYDDGDRNKKKKKIVEETLSRWRKTLKSRGWEVFITSGTCKEGLYFRGIINTGESMIVSEKMFVADAFNALSWLARWFNGTMMSISFEDTNEKA